MIYPCYAITMQRQTFKSYLPRYAILLVSLTLTACDQLSDWAIDCLDDDQPELAPTSLPNPILNQEYSETIVASIRNEPYDDSFSYTFQLLGSIPKGLQTETVRRELRIFGTPTELGDFNFSITVEVTDGGRGTSNISGLCSTIDTEKYEWSVQMF